MPYRSVAPRKVVVAMALAITVAGAALVAVSLVSEPLLRAQSSGTSAPTNVRLPDESGGVDVIARALMSVFAQTDILALGESHEQQWESDLRIALVRHPDFAKKVRSIVVEFGRASKQATVDRYIRAEVGRFFRHLRERVPGKQDHTRPPR